MTGGLGLIEKEEDPFCRCGHFRSSHYRLLGADPKATIYPTDSVGFACIHCDCSLHTDIENQEE